MRPRFTFKNALGLGLLGEAKPKTAMPADQPAPAPAASRPAPVPVPAAARPAVAAPRAADVKTADLLADRRVVAAISSAAREARREAHEAGRRAERKRIASILRLGGEADGPAATIAINTSLDPTAAAQRLPAVQTRREADRILSSARPSIRRAVHEGA